MARNESDREDMIREATALRQRIEWHVPDEPETVFAGVKTDGSLALYFGPDPVYQFSREGGVRRAFVAGFLYRTQGETLARLERSRTPDETILLRRDLNASELRSFLQAMDARVDHLLQCLREGTALVNREVGDRGTLSYVSLIERVRHASPRLAPAIATRRV